MEDNFSMDWGSGGVGGGDGSGSNARDGSVGNERDGERQMKLHLLARSLFTSYCAARFLTGNPCFMLSFLLPLLIKSSFMTSYIKFVA